MTEDLLRRSLEAEAEDVVAGPDLEARVRAAVTGAATRRRRRRRTLLAAAAALVVAGGTAAVLAGRGPETNDFQTGPPSSPGTAADSTPSVPASAAPMPERAVYVSGDGTLGTLDIATGERTTIALDGSFEVNGIDLSPDGRWVYFSTCCEQDVGSTWRVPVAGGTPAQVGNAIGAHPRVSPDGRRVAAAAGQHVVVVPADGGGGDEARMAFMVDGTVSDLAWSPDGTRLAFTERAVESAPAVVVLRFDGRDLVPDEDHPPQEGRFALWRPDGGLEVLAGGPLVDSIVSLSQDAAYTWFLALDQDGTLSGHEGTGPTGLILGDIDDAVAADW